MQKILIQFLTAIALTIAAILAFAKGANAGDIVVADISATHLKGARTGAVYFTLTNQGPDFDALIGISSDVAEEVMLHESKNEDDVMRMLMVERLEIKPGEKIDLRTSGMHVMLSGLKAPLNAGQSVTLHLMFEKSGTVDVTAVVGAR